MRRNSVLHARIVARKDDSDLLKHAIHELPGGERALRRRRRLAAQARNKREGRLAEAAEGLNRNGSKFKTGARVPLRSHYVS